MMQTLRNISCVRLFLGFNILLLTVALFRMRLMKSSENELTNPRTAINTRGLKSMELPSGSTCSCQDQKAKIVNLEHKLNNVTNQLMLETSEKHILVSKLKTAKENSVHVSDNFQTKSRIPQKIGEDIKHEEEFQVPNIVHYIWYNTEPAPFQFHHMLSVLAAHKFIKPDTIYFHTNVPPTGKYWDRIQTIPEFKLNKREPPSKAFGEEIKAPKFYTSHSNVDRVLVLKEFGGIYMDFDFIALNSFDDLRRHVCTIGLESDTKACGSVMICSKHAFFLYLWINAYFDDYRVDEWAYNTGKVPFNLANRYPELVHVNKNKLNRPNFEELGEIWSKPTWWNWRENYGFHSWYRLMKENYGGQWFNGTEPNEENVKQLDNTFGEIARVILYDTPDFIK